MESEKWRKEKARGWVQELTCPLKFSSASAREQQAKKKKKIGSVQMPFTCGPTSLERPTGKRDVEEEGEVQFKRWWGGGGGIELNESPWAKNLKLL